MTDLTPEATTISAQIDTSGAARYASGVTTTIRYVTEGTTAPSQDFGLYKAAAAVRREMYNMTCWEKTQATFATCAQEDRGMTWFRAIHAHATTCKHGPDCALWLLNSEVTGITGFAQRLRGLLDAVSQTLQDVLRERNVAAGVVATRAGSFGKAG